MFSRHWLGAVLQSCRFLSKAGDRKQLKLMEHMPVHGILGPGWWDFPVMLQLKEELQDPGQCSRLPFLPPGGSASLWWWLHSPSPSDSPSWENGSQLESLSQLRGRELLLYPIQYEQSQGKTLTGSMIDPGWSHGQCVVPGQFVSRKEEEGKMLVTEKC